MLNIFQMILIPVFGVWMGAGLITAVMIFGTIGWCTLHLFKDMVMGMEGKIWCPVLKQDMKVGGVPNGTIYHPFATIRTCEQWGEGKVCCGKYCLMENTTK